MSEAPDSLYGAAEAALPPAPKGPGLMEQLAGIFTSPLQLFDRLHAAPSWVPAYLVAAFSTLTLTLTWVYRLDWIPFIAEQAAKAGKPAQEIPESALGFIRGMATLQMLVVSFCGLLLFGLILWGLARWLSEAGDSLRFGHAMATLAVPSLVKLPVVLLGTVALATRPVEHTPEWYLPTNLGFYLDSDSPKLHALYHHLDPFGLAFGVLGFLALRRILRLSVPASASLVVLYNLLFTLWPILGAK